MVEPRRSVLVVGLAMFLAGLVGLGLFAQGTSAGPPCHCPGTFCGCPAETLLSHPVFSPFVTAALAALGLVAVLLGLENRTGRALGAGLLVGLLGAVTVLLYGFPLLGPMTGYRYLWLNPLEEPIAAIVLVCFLTLLLGGLRILREMLRPSRSSAAPTGGRRPDTYW